MKTLQELADEIFTERADMPTHALILVAIEGGESRDGVHRNSTITTLAVCHENVPKGVLLRMAERARVHIGRTVPDDGTAESALTIEAVN